MKTPDQRSVTVGKVSADSFWEDFNQRNAPQEIPAGAISIKQYAERFSISLAKAQSLLHRRSGPNGDLTEHKIRVLSGCGMRMNLFYTPKSDLTKMVFKRRN